MDKKKNGLRQSNVPYTEWDNDACVNLAAAIIEEAQRAYINAYIRLKECEYGYVRQPIEKQRILKSNFELAKSFFATKYFMTPSLGQVSTADVLAYLDGKAEEELKKFRARAQRITVN